VQRAAIFSRGNFGVGFFGLRAGALFGQRHDKFQCGVIFLQPFEIHFREGDGGKFFRAHQFGELAHAGKREFLQIFRHGRGGEIRGVRKTHGLANGFKLHAGEHGFEEHGRRDGIGDVQFVDFFVALGMLVQAIEHHFLVFIGNEDVGDGRGVVDHFFGDFFRAFGLRLSPQNSGKQSSSKAHSRAGLHEMSPIQHHRSPLAAMGKRVRPRNIPSGCPVGSMTIVRSGS